MRESVIEKNSKKWAKANGWFSFKLVTSQMQGLPDQCFIGHGKTVFIEFKNEKGVVSPIQSKVHRIFKDHGIVVYICRSVEDTMEVLTNAN